MMDTFWCNGRKVDWNLVGSVASDGIPYSEHSDMIEDDDNVMVFEVSQSAKTRD